jgi:hypothetical protein
MNKQILSLILFFIIISSCYGQVDSTLTFVRENNPAKTWSCPLPVGAKIHADKNSVFPCVIIASDGFALTIIQPITQREAANDPTFSDNLLRLAKQEKHIDKNDSLSEEQKRKAIIEKRIGVYYRDTTMLQMSQIDRIEFYYNKVSLGKEILVWSTFWISGFAFATAFIEHGESSDKNFTTPKSNGLVFIIGLQGTIASLIWAKHTYHKFISTKRWRINR